ncbi:MAG: carbohydrate-binding family 9-like protein [Candidatus Hydrogenedentes bacterium]|nr:carbohydrate-binding family 9-like protein [Candidatus Hydrogenedentota bacterium]
MMRTWMPVILAMLAIPSFLAAAPPDAPGAKPEYVAQRAPVTPSLKGEWDGPAWGKAPALDITHFFTKETGMPTASDFRPDAKAKVLYDDKGLYIHFLVNDQYVRCIETKYHGKVWEDSAVEFFVKPKEERGYFNFEINCGGVMLLSYHENPDYKGPVQNEESSVPEERAKAVTIFHSMPATVDPEIAEKTTWHIEYFIPFDLLEEYIGPLGDVPGQVWHANFYKIAENNSHPHYGAWSPILEGHSFHAPQFFGVLRFAPRKP